MADTRRVRHPQYFDARRLLSQSHEQASDLELARIARAGDESAFEEIMRRYSPRVFRFASRFFRQRSLVEEAAQEVFLKAFTELGSFEGPRVDGRLADADHHEHLPQSASQCEATTRIDSF